MPVTITQMDSTIVRLQHSLTGLSQAGLLEKHLNGWKARQTRKQCENWNTSWFIGYYLQHFKRGNADIVGVWPEEVVLNNNVAINCYKIHTLHPRSHLQVNLAGKICCFYQPADVVLHSIQCDNFFWLIFRLQLDANDASYCIHGPIHLCLFPSPSPPFTHPLTSVISFCNESSSAHQWLKMILEILIRALF